MLHSFAHRRGGERSSRGRDGHYRIGAKIPDMKRGAPSSGRSSGSRNTSARHHADDDTAPSRESLPAATSPASAAAAASAGHGEGTNYLVALAGMRALESHVQDSSRGRRWKDRVTSWEERAGLGLPSVKLALGFLDVLGVSRASVYKQLLENALRALLDQIPHLTEERMLLLLNDSFRYATQPELKSVPLKIITSMSAVPDKVLEKIIELQTHEPSQFEELGLPLAIKRLAWEKDAKLFVRIASPHASKYISSEYSPKMIVASQQVRFYKQLDTTKRRKLMGPQRINALAECTGGRPILIGYLCDDIADKFKDESSLSKAGMWATLLTDVLVTARERAYGSIADQSVDRLCALASRLDLAVREDVFGDATVRDVQRLFREATGIVEGQQEVAKGTKRAAALDKAKAEDESTKLRKTLKSAWSAVSKMDSKSWFKEAVTEAIALGYHKVVKVPMDLGTILKKIKGGGYPSFGDFDRDLKLMWENCRLYNSEGSTFHKEALRLEQEWSKVSTSFEDTLRYGQNRPSQNPSTSATGSSHKRKGSSSSQDDARGGGSSGNSSSGGAPLTTMAPATQLDGQGLGRRVGLAAMLLSEPFVAKLMYRHASERVPEACRGGETLPRNHPTYAPLMQLLELGDAARAMFRAGSFGVRAVEQNLTRAVLPSVVALHARAEGAIARRADAPDRADGPNGASGPEAPVGAAAAAAAAAVAAVAAAAAAAKKQRAAREDAEDAAAAPPQDWKTWYKEFPAVRRVVCTMLCRALVRSGDEAAVLMMPAARAAVRKMADELWLWASLAELVQKSATMVAKAGDDAKKAGRVLKPETLRNILELFLRGLESATVSDAVFSKALSLVANLLQLSSRSSPAPAPSSSAAAVAAKPVLGSVGVKSVGVPRAALEELVDKAAARAVRPPRKPRTEAEEERVNGEFERVFSLAPEWKNKLHEKRREAAAATAAAAEKRKEAAIAAAAAARREASARSGAGGKVAGGKVGSGRGGSGSGKGGGGGGGGSRPARSLSIKGPKSVSIKGPKSFSIKGPKRKGGEGGHAGGSEAAPKKRSRG